MGHHTWSYFTSLKKKTYYLLPGIWDGPCWKRLLERERKRERGQAVFLACASSHLSEVVLLWDNAQQSSCVVLAPSTPPPKPELAKSNDVLVIYNAKSSSISRVHSNACHALPTTQGHSRLDMIHSSFMLNQGRCLISIAKYCSRALREWRSSLKHAKILNICQKPLTCLHCEYSKHSSRTRRVALRIFTLF